MNRVKAALIAAGALIAAPALAQDGHDQGPPQGGHDGGGHQHWNGGNGGGGGRPAGAPGQPGGGAPQAQEPGRQGGPPPGARGGNPALQNGDLRERGFAGGDPVSRPGFGNNVSPAHPGGDGHFDGRPGDGRPGGGGRFDTRPGDGRPGGDGHFDGRPGFQGRPGFDGRPGGDPRAGQPGRFDGRPGDGRPGYDPRAGRPGYDPRFAGGPGGRGGDWNRGWRDDRRYDWQGWRNQHRELYRVGPYRAPYGYGYRRFGIGAAIAPAFFAEQFWIADPFYYRLPPAYGPYRWVRYFNDAVLVNVYSGVVADVIPGFFF